MVFNFNNNNEHTDKIKNNITAKKKFFRCISNKYSGLACENPHNTEEIKDVDKMKWYYCSHEFKHHFQESALVKHQFLVVDL